MNVLWFCLDTLRADHLSCYDYFRKTSPTIDRLAAEGALFPQSRANAVATGPAFTSMVTGRYALNNEWYYTPWDVPDMANFPDAQRVFPETIWDDGRYTTAAFDNLFSFSSHMKQFVRGFEYYVNCTGSSKPVHHHLIGENLNARLLPWIRQHRAEPFFLYVHYWDPHAPYNQPREFARPFVHEPGNLDDLEVREAPAGYRYVPGWHRVEEIGRQEGRTPPTRTAKEHDRYPVSIDTYDGEILYTDHLIDQVLNELADCGILDETAVIVNADHGEQLNLHLDTWDHFGLHDANVFTPTVIWRPGLLPAGARPEGCALHVDLAPTILDLLDVKPDSEFDGRSLLPAIHGKERLPDHYYSETIGLRSVFRDGWKYIWWMKHEDELYNLDSDPLELINLIDKETDRAETLRADLFSWVEKNLQGRPEPLEAAFANAERARGKLRIYSN
jgi:arylsulfatase